MKRNVAKFVSTIVFGTICMMTACSGEELDEIVVEDYVEGSHWQRADINLHVNRISFDAETGTTRSVDEGWKHGDCIYLILKNNAGNNVQAYVEYDTVTTSWGQVKYDAYKAELTCTTPRMVEAYYFDGTVNVKTSNITFNATTGVYACTDGIYTYPTDGNLEVNISLIPLTSRIRFSGEAGTQFVISGMTSYTAFSRTTGELSVTTSDITTYVQSSGYTPYIYGVFCYPSAPSLVVKNGSNYFRTIFDSSTNVLQVGHSGYMAVPTTDSHNGWKLVTPTTGISINQSGLALMKNETASLKTTITPSNATPSAIIWSSSDNSVATVSDEGVVTAVGFGGATITAMVEDYPNLTATCKVNVVDANGCQYVDLGLSSGTLWAAMNLGATSPSDHGDYYAWGEMTSYNSGKTSFDWSTYEYCKGTEDTMTKYCTNSSYGSVDNKTELELSDDVARLEWGGTWRMPSTAQFNELKNECTWSWTTLNGVKGYKVSSTKNKQSLFLPAAGYYRSTSPNYVGSEGNYWSRSLSSGSSYNACRLYFYSSYIGSSSYSYRYCGQSVRPVLGSE